MRRSTRTLCFSAAALLVLVSGTGLADDADTAKLRQAAEQGNPVAQLRLAWLIDPGLTTLSAGPNAPEDADPEDYAEAAKWYRLAAEQIEEARRAARDWHETHQRSPGTRYTANRDSPVWQSEIACKPATEVASADS